MKRSRPTKIAFVSDAVYPYHMGGKEKRLNEITTRLAKEGHDVHVYTMNWWKGARIIERDGVTFHAISKLHPLYVDERRSMTQAIWFGLAVYKLMFAKFDVIDVDSMPFFPLYAARIVCSFKNKPLNATWHEVTSLPTWQGYVGRTAGLVAWCIERVAQLLPDQIISNSDFTTERLRSTGVRCPVITVPLGISSDFIYSVPVGNTSSDIFFAGRLLAHKNVDLLLQAIKLVKADYPSISCIVVGEGPEKERLSQLAYGLGIEKNVQFVNFMESASDMFSLMKASKMFVLPSTREGFSLVAIEANAAGLPVVTIDHPENNARNLITNGLNGYLVDPTPESIATGIKKVLSNRTELNPSAKTDQYDWKLVTAKIESALRV